LSPVPIPVPVSNGALYGQSIAGVLVLRQGWGRSGKPLDLGSGRALYSVLLRLSRPLFSNRLPGGGITFFAAAKKVIKESSFLQPDTAA
jgi:hypothetical protein